MICGRIFPNEKLLNLHFKECHDPLTRELQQRGEKTVQSLSSFIQPGERKKETDKYLILSCVRSQV